MQIPLKQVQPKHPPLELVSIKLYSTGLKKVFTDRFYKSMNHNFGVEMLIRNNTERVQIVKIGGCINNTDGKLIIKWNPKNKKIAAHSSIMQDFYVKEDSFAEMKTGKYIIQFWINDKKVQNQQFTITYK